MNICNILREERKRDTGWIGRIIINYIKLYKNILCYNKLN